MSTVSSKEDSEPAQDPAFVTTGAKEDSARSDPTAQEADYWKANLRVLLPLLVLWFVVSYGAGILFVEPLNQLRVPFTECPLGFWFAQQGSIFTFILIIYAYVRLMNRLDRELGVQED